VEEALRRSGVLERCPEIDLQRSRVGIFGRFCTLDQVLEDGDRVEIYRPLAADPKDLRRARLAAKKAGGKGR
jgi:putative ubiquitin-RnfH superfamily antitoxin RatB of RatAB toxin-antitoxin module